ncbi:MAG: hypothetical protein ACFB0G_01255 [Leptolyngbyaceae cyanobacterium]
MLCFEITINGGKRIIAGFDEIRVLTAILSYRAADADNEDDLRMSVSGMNNHGRHDHEHIEWLKQSLDLGDEMTIRLIESDESTMPIERRREDPDLVRKAERRYYEKLKQDYEES